MVLWDKLRRIEIRGNTGFAFVISGMAIGLYLYHKDFHGTFDTNGYMSFCHTLREFLIAWFKGCIYCAGLAVPSVLLLTFFFASKEEREDWDFKEIWAQSGKFTCGMDSKFFVRLLCSVLTATFLFLWIIDTGFFD
jgi:hypothetical protein